MYNNCNTDLEHEAYASRDPSCPEGPQQREESDLRNRRASSEDSSAVTAYFRTVASCPLLKSEEEKELAREIRACQDRLLELFMSLPSTFNGMEELKGEIRRVKGDEQRRKGDLIEKVLWQLRELDGETVSEGELRILLDTIRPVAGQLQRAFDKMVRSNQRLVLSVARHYTNRGLPLLDLIQEGNLGLMKAVARFDPARGCRFATYAWWWVWQAVHKATRQKGRMIHMPVSMLDAARRYRRAISSLAEQSREARPKEIMEEARLSIRQFEALQAPVTEPISLDIPMGDTRSLLDLLSCPDSESPSEVISQKELSRELRSILKALSPREEKIITQRFGINLERGYTLDEIGKQLGLSRERVRQIERRALEKLKLGKTQDRLRELAATAE